MTVIDPADYWPQYFHPDTVGHWARFAYPAVGEVPGYASTFFYDPATRAMKLAQYGLDGVWQCSWYMQREADGLFEVRDELPQTSPLLAWLFGPLMIETYSTPIGWGYRAHEVGNTVNSAYANSPSFSGFGCRPPQFGSGRQVVLFEKFLPLWTDDTGHVWKDVLQMFYQQSWGGGPPRGSRAMMVKGVGPIAIQWVNGNTVEPWQTAAYTKA